MNRYAAFAGALVLALAAAGAVRAGAIQGGDLIVVDRGNGTVDDINPTTGASVVIASGFSNPQGIAINSQGTIFVSDIGTSSIAAINPTTSVVTTFSGNGVGSGPTLNRPFQMAFSSGSLYVAEGGVPNGNDTAVYAIAPNGNRTLVAGNNGSSNNLFAGSLAGLALDSSGQIFASEATGAHTIYRVGPGTAAPLTSAVTAPQGLAFAINGQLLAVSGDPSNPLVASIDPITGNTTTLSDNNGIGAGPAYGSLRGIVGAANGLIYVTDASNNEILAVDPATGNRSILSGNGVGGTTFGALTYGIAIYPSVSTSPTPPTTPTGVSEPSSLALLALGGVALAGWRRWRKSARIIV